MHSTTLDYSILDKFNFEHKPVGVKFLLNKPAGIKKLDKSFAFCEMLRETQQREPFYAAQENFACMGPVLLGMREADPIFESGQVGAKDGIYKKPAPTAESITTSPSWPRARLDMSPSLP